VAESFGVEDIEDVAMVYAMLSKYKKVHEKLNLTVAVCEVAISTPDFYGIVDAVMYDDTGFWIVDMKTAGTLPNYIVNTAPSHPQLNLYAAHADLIRKAAMLPETKPFLGCRLRTTTKSKLGKKPDEAISAYIGRMASGIKSQDIAIPHDPKMSQMFLQQLVYARSKTSKANNYDIGSFSPNFGNCMAYFRPCEHYSKCHGRNYTEVPTMEVTLV
jgi:hypothetical protein